MHKLHPASHGTVARLAALAIALAASLPAAAMTSVDFFGSLMNSNPPASNSPPCGAQLTVINKNDPPLYKSAGLSNLGEFTFSLLQCLIAPQNGTIGLDFGGGNTLLGSYASTVTPTATSGLSAYVGEVVVTGGTGSFLHYGGSFTVNGYLDRRAGTVADSGAVFRGVLTVPEPATWGLMLAGTVGVIAIARRRQAGRASRKDFSTA